ncbi:hypothetical protein ACWDUL_21180 [Nocardia niigatensis]
MIVIAATGPRVRPVHGCARIDRPRRHIRWLLGLGFCEQAIAAAAAFDPATITTTLTTDTTHIPAHLATKILAVSHIPVPAQAGYRVPTVGSVRRIRALQALSWSIPDIASRLGFSSVEPVCHVIRGHRCTYEAWARIRDLYQQMSTTSCSSPRAPIGLHM